MCVVVTCEHGGNRVPARYRSLFAGREALLQSHRGWDPGALALARQFARVLHVPLYFSTVTRLLVELNRSPHHRGLFSAVSKQLSREECRRVLAAYYQPYRQTVAQSIEAAVRSGGRVLHVSVHTFTPVLDGQVRAVDVGLLYDPRRALEKRLCLRWRQAIEAAAPELRVRMNQPYRGMADGLTTHLRRRWPDRLYAGVELEVNQRFLADAGHWRRLGRLLPRALAAVLPTADQPPPEPR